MVFKKILIIGLLCAYVDIMAVNVHNLPGEIVKALEKGDSKSISNYFNSSVELIFSDSQKVYGKSQAEQILKNFFINNGPGEFRYKHLHKMDKDNAQYFIGELRTAKGLYRLNIYMKDQRIYQMRIENND